MRNPHGISIFCDDIREEKSGKLIYVGVYAGTLAVLDEKYPLQLPQISIAVHTLIPSDYVAEQTQFTLKVYLSENNEEPGFLVLERPPVNVNFDGNTETYIHYNFRIRLPQIVIRQESRLKVRGYFSDGSEIKLGVLNVKANVARKGDKKAGSK